MGIVLFPFFFNWSIQNNLNKLYSILTPGEGGVNTIISLIRFKFGIKLPAVLTKPE